MVLREYSDLRMIISLRLYGAYINVFYADGQLKFFDVKAYYGGMPLRIPDYDLDGELESVLVDDTDLIVTTDRRRVTLVFSEDLIRYCETDSCDLTVKPAEPTEPTEPAKPAEPTTPRSGVRMLAYENLTNPSLFYMDRAELLTRRSRVLMLAYGKPCVSGRSHRNSIHNPKTLAPRSGAPPTFMPHFFPNARDMPPTLRSRVLTLAYGKPCVSGRSHRPP